MEYRLSVGVIDKSAARNWEWWREVDKDYNQIFSVTLKIYLPNLDFNTIIYLFFIFIGSELTNESFSVVFRHM